MTINELLERLEDYRDLFGGDAEVRLMTQKNWPFEYNIHGLTSRLEINDDADEEEEDREAQPVDEEGADDDVVYICEGWQLGYATERAWKIAN
jgi:hypothetical protein